MKLGEFGVGKITKQNATKDAPIGSEYSNVKKLGLGSGKPKLHNKKATKNSDPNTLFNLGIGEGVDASSLKPFVKFCIKNLELKSVPKIVITKKKLDGTFGYYDTDAKTLTVSSSDRHLADIMRTLAHELVHLAQDEQNQDIDGSDGSKHENQANAVAGVIMRKWAGKDPSLFENEEPAMLYHATYKPFLDSIMKNGLGGSGAQTQWEDSKPGYIYLAKDPEVAVSHAEANEEVPDEYIDDIVVLSIDASQLDQDNLEDDTNVMDDDSTLAYKGIIPSTAFSVQIDELKIEKPDPKDTLGVLRKDMPQVKSDDYAEFIEYLKSNGAKFTKETIPARDLKAMQKEFSDEGIMKQLMKNIEQGPNRKAVIASSDDYIMDGHHRWLVAINTGRDLNVFRINLPAYELYDLVNKFEKTYYKDIYNERGSIGVPLASGLVMSLFPHRPLKIKKSTPGKLRYDETITTVDLQQLETFADKLFAKVGIDVEFTRHFLDRVNDERNKKPITMAELTRLFKQEFKRWSKPIAQMGPGQEAVMKDLQTDINLPFALQYDKDNNELDLIAKTVMRKKDFKTPNREFPVEGWSAKYKKSINCSNPKGFSQKAHCAGKKKNEDDSKDTLGSIINFPGYEKKEKKPKYKPVPKQDKSVLDKVKSWFTDDINEGYKLRLENDEDLLVLHIRNTRTGERAEVRGNPNYEIDYDENDELHQLLDVIGKASNISELMNGEIVSVNPKHPDGPKSYAALDNAMNEDDASDKVYELLLDNIGAGPFDGGCVVVAQALQLIHGGELMALVRNDGTADHAVVQKGNTMYDFDGPGTQEEVVSRFEKNEGTRIAEVRKLRMTDLPDAPRNSELAKQIASLMKKPVQEAPTARDSMNLDADKLQQSIDYFYTDHAPKNFGSARTEGNFKGLKVVTFTKGNDTLMFLVNNDDQAVFYVMYSKFDDGVAIGNVRSNGTVKATEVYAYLVDKFGTLYSDDSQTPQGSKIWTSLAKFYPNLDVKDTGGRFVATKKTQVDEGVNDPHIFKAVFLAGGPGSGKSFVAKNILGGTGLRSINSDEVYEYLMKKQGLSLDPETIFSPQGQEIRDKAKGISRKREATYLDGRIGLIIDGTGKDVSKYQVMAQKLKAIGYDLSMIYVNTSLEVAQQRNKERERSLTPAEVEKMWNDVQQNLMQFQQIFGAGRFHIIDNSGGLEDLDRQKNFDKVYVETQRFLNTPPKNRKALAWIQKQKEQNDGQRSAQQPTTNQEPDGGTTAPN